MTHNHRSIAPGIISDINTDYRSLLGEDAWNKLHLDIQKRFSPENTHKSVIYKGVMHDIYLSFTGKLLAHLCRLIGTPLALYSGKNIPTEVKVYPNHRLNGMAWDRFYYYPNKKINRVKSTKCINPKLGLIEVVGYGFGMYLQVQEKNSAIYFESQKFFWQLGNLKIRIPELLSPGKTTVSQTALGNQVTHEK